MPSYAGAAEPSEYLVYLCGIQVPCLSVDVTVGIWDPPRCQLQFAPDPVFRRIGQDDIMPVQVFYLDVIGRSAVGQAPEWCLLFDGIISGQAYSSASGSRTTSLSAVDLTTTMMMMRMFWLTNISNLTYATTENAGNAAYSVAPEYAFPASLFYLGLNPTEKLPITRPFDFVENMFRAMCSVEEAGVFLSDAVIAEANADGDTPLSYKSVVALHWWARWAKRTAFLERWVPMPGVEDFAAPQDRPPFPILDALQKDEAVKAIKGLSNSMGDGASMWDLLRMIFQRLSYDVAMIPSPAAVQVARGVRNIIGPPVGGVPNALVQYVTKPKMPFCLAPACNVVFPGMVTSLSYSEDFLQQPTRLMLSDGTLFNVIGATESESLAAVYNAALATAWPPRAQEILDRHLGRGDNAAPDPLTNPHNLLVFPSEFFRGPVPVEAAIPSWFMYMANSAQIDLAPEVQTTVDDYKRDIQAELTRRAGSAKAEDKKALDEIKKVVDGLPTSVEEAGGTVTGKDILEAWSGVSDKLALPTGPLAGHQASYEFGAIIRGRAASLFGDGTTRQLYAAQMFAQERYKHRSGGASCLFHPYLVPGFPVAVFDRQEAAHHVEGLLMNVSHHLSADSCGTTLNFSYGRTTAELFHAARTSGYPLSTGPAEYIPKIRDTFQQVIPAEEQYRKLFYQNRSVEGRREAFDAFNTLYCRGRSDSTEIPWQPATVPSLADLDNEDVDFAFAPEFAKRVEDPAEARRMASRPVVTLPEWMALMGSYSPAKEERAKYYVPPGSRRDHNTVRYWWKILTLVPGPGTEPVHTEQGNVTQAVQADTRRDWQRRLIEYRTRFYSRTTGRLA